MKLVNAICFSTLFILYFCSCKTDKTTNSNENRDSIAMEADDPTEEIKIQDSDYLTKIPILDSITSAKTDLNNSLKEYSKIVLNPDYIRTEGQLKGIFKQRDELIENLLEVTEDHIYKLEEKGNYDDISLVEEELMSIGMQGIYAEGMFLNLTEAAILEDKINNIASRPYQLYLSFQQAFSNSLGGEYPYIDLSNQMEMITIGETLFRDFPDEDYSEEIKENFFLALHLLTDVHKVMNGFEVDHYCVYGTSLGYYPNATEIENYTTFIENYPDSRFNQTVRKIVDNMSEIQGNEETKDALYIIIIKQFENYDDCVNATRDYLMDGIDIPHSIELDPGNDESAWVAAYRFYNDKSKAENALSVIKEIKREATIIELKK